MSEEYSRDELEFISDLEHVRERPQMYFGDLHAAGLVNRLVQEAYCLAIDEALDEPCGHIRTVLTGDGFVSVTHDGEPLLVEAIEGSGGVPEIQSIAESLCFCARRAKHEAVRRHVCNNGMTSLNALCERFELHTFREGFHWLVAYERAHCATALTQIGPTSNRGVQIRFRIDAQIVPSVAIDLPELRQWLESLLPAACPVDLAWEDQR